MKFTRTIEISDELEAQIITDSIYESIEMMYDDIVYLSNLEHLSDCQKEDLSDHFTTIRALKEVYRYYTISSQWSTLDRFPTLSDHVEAYPKAMAEEEYKGTESTVPFEAPMFVHGKEFVEEACDEPDESLKSDSLVNQSDLQWM